MNLNFTTFINLILIILLKQTYPLRIIASLLIINKILESSGIILGLIFIRDSHSALLLNLVIVYIIKRVKYNFIN